VKLPDDNLDRAANLAGTTTGDPTPDTTDLTACGATTHPINLLGLPRMFAPAATTDYVRDPTGQPGSQCASARRWSSS
jgi:hypothetical protein